MQREEAGMLYPWVVFLRVISVFHCLLLHGSQMAVTFKLREQTDPARVGGGFITMPNSLTPLRISYAAIIVIGLIAGFMSVWWRQGWMWTSLVLLIAIAGLMNRIGAGYFITVEAAASHALKSQDDPSGLQKFNAVKNTKRPEILSLVGLIGLAVILRLMMFKPF
jgi:hypothetical protein